MTTARSPLRILKAQADKIAKTVKAISRGEDVGAADPGGKIAAALATDSFKVGVVMDDKVITIEVPWSTIRDTSEVAISEFILRQMREARDTVQ